MKFDINSISKGLIVLLILSLTNCGNENFPDPDIKCENFPERDGGAIVGPIIQKSTQKKAPCFNPNNGEELVFIKHIDKKQFLIKGNWRTGEEIILLENVNIVGQPDWGTNNKIIFIEGYQIKYIDLNAEIKKTNITKSEYHLYPKWLDETTIISEFSFNLGMPYYRKRINILSGDFDTLRDQKFTLGCLNKNFDIALINSRDNPNITIIQESNKLTIGQKEFNGKNRIEGMSWISTLDLIYSTYRTGIFRVDVNNKKEICIKSACDARSYRFLSLPPDKSYIVAERVDATEFNVNDGSWKEESKIVIMNLDGSNERVLFE